MKSFISPDGYPRRTQDWFYQTAQIWCNFYRLCAAEHSLWSKWQYESIVIVICWNLQKFRIFHFFRILLVQVEENYTKNYDLQFLFQIKIANAILHADEVRRFNATRLSFAALLHVTQFFFELQIYKKMCQKLCLVKLFISLPKTIRKNRWISAF